MRDTAVCAPVNSDLSGENARRAPLTEMCDDALRPASFLYLAWLGSMCGLACLVYLIWHNAPGPSVLPSILLYYLILSIHVVVRIQTVRRINLLAPDFVFLVVYTLFHLGYVTLFAARLVPYSSEVFYFHAAIPQSLFVINLGLVGLVLGYELMGLRVGAHAVQPLPQCPSQLCLWLGTVLLALALLSHVGVLLTLGMDYLTRYGYVGIQRIGQHVPYYQALLLSMSGLPATLGLILHTVGSTLRYGRLFRSKLALCITITFFILYILEGDRDPILKLGAPLLLIQHYFVKRVRLPHMLAIVLGALFLFTAMRAVRSIVFDPARMLQEYRYQRESGELRWMNPFLEMGGSFIPLNITTHEVPAAHGYWYGTSYLAAAVHMVPFLQGFAAQRGWLPLPPGHWVTYTYFGRNAAGRGYTIAAEGYANFGYLGAFCELLAFGLFIRWVSIRFCQTKTAASALVLFATLSLSLMVIRNELNVITHELSFALLVAWFLGRFLSEGNAPGSLSG